MFYPSSSTSASATVASEFYPSYCSGAPASTPSSLFFKSGLTVAADTYLMRFQIPQQATSFEIKGG